MKIGFFQDVHANLPALKAAISYFEVQNCDRIIHIGDFVGIGPYPKECIAYGATIEKLEHIMGNHDYWYAFGLPQNGTMSREEIAHQNWTHEAIGPDFKGFVQSWPFSISIQLKPDYSVIFQHYGLNEIGDWFLPIVKEPDSKELDQLFAALEANMICYGHHHIANEQIGQKHYVNLGSAGCWDKPAVRVGLLEERDGKIRLNKAIIPYEDNGLLEEFDRKEVPARDFIRSVFIKR